MFSRLLSGLLVSAMLLGSALTAQAQQTLNFALSPPRPARISRCFGILSSRI